MQKISGHLSPTTSLETHFPVKDPVISYTATGNAALVALALVLAVVFSYIAQAWKMDRESENLMKALDLEVAPEFFGPKRIDVYGRLRRADTSVICKSATTDWSNSATCLSNANLHANCLRICDSSVSACAGCSALVMECATQLATAVANCNYKSNYVCPLNTNVDGIVDMLSWE